MKNRGIKRVKKVIKVGVAVLSYDGQKYLWESDWLRTSLIEVEGILEGQLKKQFWLKPYESDLVFFWVMIPKAGRNSRRNSCKVSQDITCE